MSDWFAQDGENKKCKVQKPRNKGQTGRVVQRQGAVVWHPTDLATGATGGGLQGTQASSLFLGAEGQSNRPRIRSQEMLKRRGHRFLEKGRATTPEKQV